MSPEPLKVMPEDASTKCQEPLKMNAGGCFDKCPLEPLKRMPGDASAISPGAPENECRRVLRRLLTEPLKLNAERCFDDFPRGP